jgi:hypothetical protein
VFVVGCIKVIAFEYDMQPVKGDGEDGVMLALQVRAAVAGYVLRRWNVDCSKEPSQESNLDGPAYHLWLKNQQCVNQQYDSIDYQQPWFVLLESLHQ